MERIQGLQQTIPVVAPAARRKASAAPSSPIQDTFTRALAASCPAETTKPLTTEQIQNLGSQYDVKNMTRNQFNALLKELRDAGAITQKAFSDGYSGPSPEGNPVPMPSGGEPADFLHILACRSLDCSASQTDDPQQKALAESYSQLYKTINSMNIAYRRMNPKSPEEIAAEMVARNSRTPAELGMPDLTGMNDTQKLLLLQKLHKNTDYSGMEDVAKYKLIHDRFEAAFPTQMAYSTYEHGHRVFTDRAWRSWTGPDPLKYEPKTMRDYIRDELENQMDSAELIALPKMYHAKAYYGSGEQSRQSDEVVYAIIRLRHSGGTAADHAAMLEELQLWKGDSNSAVEELSFMREQLKGMEPSTPLSWQELREAVSAHSDDLLQAKIDQLLDDLEKVLR